MSQEYIEKQWREITSRNPVSGANFPQGLKDYKFSVGQGYGYIPSQSYFRVDLKVTANDQQPIEASKIAFADSVCGNLFNNVYFQMGGQTVSSISTGLPQCEILKNRLTKSSTYNKTVGATQGFLASHEERLQSLAVDANVAGNGAGDPNKRLTRGKNTRMFIWNPALGINDVSHPLGSGEYTIQLNPSQDYKKSAIDTILGGLDLAVGVGAQDFDVEVVDIRYYACMVRVNLPTSGTETLHLMEMSVHTATVNTASGEVNEEVSVPSSTRAITLFLQDQTAGKNTTCPPSKFHALAESNALSLKNYQIQYANITKPSVRFESNYDTNINLLHQRYITSALESGQYFNPAGFETLEEFLERGPYVHESFIKSADNLATRAQIVASYGTIDTPCRLFVVAHHSRTIQITRQNGMITEVQTLNV
jgi:hypothetical protein